MTMAGEGRPRPRSRRELRQMYGPYGRVQQAVNELDDRLGIARGGRVLMDKIFPDHWSFMLGEIALYSFVVLIATGIFLSLYYVPGSAPVVYHGAYKPLDGTTVSEAYASTINISFAVRAGLLIRQMHHWAADVFIGSIVVHMARIFFTGAFRKPREMNWLIGISLLALAIANGFLGYSLPDDLVSGTGIRILYSIIESVPFVGGYLATFVFGGGYPGNIILERFYLLHILIIPLILIGLISVHLGLLVHQKHTQFPGGARTEKNVIGSPMYPTFAAKTTGFLFMITAALTILGGFAQINPIWQFGSYSPPKITYAVQPDWYMGFVDGVLRIMPSWEFTAWGHTIPWEVFVPAIVFPGIVFTLAALWPAIERKFTGDDEIHHLLDRPRMRPKRTAAGAAMLTLLFTSFGASATDVLANFFHLSLNEVLWFFRIAIIVAPIIAGFVAWRVCIEMQRVPGAVKRKRAMVVSRTAAGEYVATPADERPGDESRELEPVLVPARIDLDGDDERDGQATSATEEAGVRRVLR